MSLELNSRSGTELTDLSHALSGHDDPVVEERNLGGQGLLDLGQTMTVGRDESEPTLIPLFNEDPVQVVPRLVRRRGIERPIDHLGEKG
jgi:hypothetical protein